MTQKLEKRTLLGLDITPRFWLWDEITQLDEDCKRLDKALSNKQDECNKKRADIDRLCHQAATFAVERNEYIAKVETLEAQIQELTSELNAADLRISNSAQPRDKGKFTKKEKHGKPAE